MLGNARKHDYSTERGAAMVLFAIILPLCLAFGSFVITIGNWWVHKRHLQTQVDAAVLASGPEFVGCFLDPTNANLAIASRALAFAGDTLRPGQSGPGATSGTTNFQVQQPNDVRVVLNSASYWAQVNGTDPNAPSAGYGLDNTLDSADADLLGDPCNERYLDAKATDDEAPTLWGWLPFVASPKAQAKVAVFDVESNRGMLPWAVPEIDPRRVVALFVNEDIPANQAGSVFDHQLLEEADNLSLPWSEWETSTGEEPVRLESANDNTGVVILISKEDDVPTLQVTGTLQSICSQDPGLVACYGGSSQDSGLSFIHAYNGGGLGTLANPIVRDVELVDVGCSAADQSAPYFTLDGNCTATISAVVDFGVVGPLNPGLWPTCVTVTASPGGTMSWSGNVPGGSLFTQSMNLPAGTGRSQTVLDLSWESLHRPLRLNCNQTVFSGNFNKVAAPYVANSASGPVEYLQLTATQNDGVTTVGDANSVEKNDPGQTYHYTVTVGLPKPHSVTANYQDPPILLRLGSGSGSQNHAFDCDKNINYETEIELGCQTRYIENYRDPDGIGPQPAYWNNFPCTGWGTGNLPPPTFDGPSPYPSDCVLTETGDKTGPQRDGLHARFETPCTYNNWPDNATELAEFMGPNGYAAGTDPRYVTLVITDDTAFTGSGNDPLPIKYFAGFYVTGWDYHSIQSPGCPDPDGPSGPLKGNDCHPRYGCSYQEAVDNGDVWGYFVDIVLPSDAGDPSDELCSFGSEPAACIAILVE